MKNYHVKIGRSDEVPNIELAEYLYEHNDADGIKEIIGGLRSKDIKLIY